MGRDSPSGPACTGRLPRALSRRANSIGLVARVTPLRPPGNPEASANLRSLGGFNVAFRGIKPDPATAIQAVTGSGLYDG